MMTLSLHPVCTKSSNSNFCILIVYFSSPEELVHCTRSLSIQRAKAVVSYLQHKFDEDMLPHKPTR